MYLFPSHHKTVWLPLNYHRNMQCLVSWNRFILTRVDFVVTCKSCQLQKRYSRSSPWQTFFPNCSKRSSDNFPFLSLLEVVILEPGQLSWYVAIDLRTTRHWTIHWAGHAFVRIMSKFLVFWILIASCVQCSVIVVRLLYNQFGAYMSYSVMLHHHGLPTLWQLCRFARIIFMPEVSYDRMSVWFPSSSRFFSQLISMVTTGSYRRQFLRGKYLIRADEIPYIVSRKQFVKAGKFVSVLVLLWLSFGRSFIIPDQEKIKSCILDNLSTQYLQGYIFYTYHCSFINVSLQT